MGGHYRLLAATLRTRIALNTSYVGTLTTVLHVAAVVPCRTRCLPPRDTRAVTRHATHTLRRRIYRRQHLVTLPSLPALGIRTISPRRRLRFAEHNVRDIPNTLAADVAHFACCCTAVRYALSRLRRGLLAA